MQQNKFYCSFSITLRSSDRGNCRLNVGRHSASPSHHRAFLRRRVSRIESDSESDRDISEVGVEVRTTAVEVIVAVKVILTQTQTVT